MLGKQLHWISLSEKSGFPDSSVDKESACNVGGPSSIPGFERSSGEWMDYPLQYFWASPVAQLVTNPPVMQETWVRSPGLGRSPGEGRGYPLQYSGLENSRDCIVHGVTKSPTQLSDFHFTLSKYRLFTKWILEYWRTGFSSKESLCEEVDSLKLLDRFLYHIREGNGNPLQYSCLENSMGRGAWRATAHGVAKSWTWLSD